MNKKIYQPALTAEIEQDGKIEYSYFALKNAYFPGEGGWSKLLEWADGHGYTVNPRDPGNNPAVLVRISKGK